MLFTSQLPNNAEILKEKKTVWYRGPRPPGQGPAVDHLVLGYSERKTFSLLLFISLIHHFTLFKKKFIY